MPVLAPTSVSELADLVAAAAGEGRRLEIRGGGTKADFGARGGCDAILDMGGFSGVIAYDPPELVLTARSGTPLAEIEALLAAENQMLAFEPYEQGVLWGRGAGATIGGTIAAGVSGPRRVSRGAARDHVLGFEAVSGRGERFVAGGKVVKNVTGFDLPKLLTGSWGQLAALTEVTLKVVPRPRATASFALDGLAPADAQRAMNAAMGSAADIAAAAHVPAPDARTAFRLEGIVPSIEARARHLADLLGPQGRLRRLDESEAAAFWLGVREPAELGSGLPLWRLHLPPARGAEVAEMLSAQGAAEWLLDWAGGLLWLASDCVAAGIRVAAEAAGGHAMLVRAPLAMRLETPALHPPAPGVATIEQRVRAAFDPAGVFASQRFASQGAADAH